MFFFQSSVSFYYSYGFCPSSVFSSQQLSVSVHFLLRNVTISKYVSTISSTPISGLFLIGADCLHYYWGGIHYAFLTAFLFSCLSAWVLFFYLFKNVAEYLTTDTAQVLRALKTFLLIYFVPSTFLFCL